MIFPLMSKLAIILVCLTVGVFFGAFILYQMPIDLPPIPLPSFPPVLKPPLLIVVDDSLASNPKLLEFISLRSQAYSITVKQLSQITNTIEERTFVKMSSVQSIVFTSSNAISDKFYLLSNAYGYYSTLAYATNSQFTIIRQPNDPVEVCPFMTGFGGGWSATLSYNNGQTITVTMPSDTPEGYLWWGHPRLLSTGQVVWRKTRADDIRDYILGSGASIALIVGGPAVEGFSLHGTMPNSYTVWDSMTDGPFMARDIASTNKLMYPTVTVGRLPARTNAELTAMLSKILIWQPHQTNKYLLYQGFEEQATYDTLKAALQSSLSTMTRVELAYTSEETLIAALNNENDYFIAYTHGGTSSLGPLQSGSILTRLTMQKSCLTWAVSCDTGDYSLQSWRGPGECFLMDADSNMAAYFGSPLPPNALGAAELCISFFNANGNLGQKYLKAKQTFQAQSLPYDRLNMNFFGDPTCV